MSNTSVTIVLSTCAIFLATEKGKVGFLNRHVFSTFICDSRKLYSAHMIYNNISLYVYIACLNLIADLTFSRSAAGCRYYQF